jgi:hypothetical protein
VRPGDILRATTTVDALTLEKQNRSWDWMLKVKKTRGSFYNVWMEIWISHILDFAQVGVIVDFLGIRRPQRVIDVYKVDGRPWHLIMRALNASFVADGDVTLVLERRLWP